MQCTYGLRMPLHLYTNERLNSIDGNLYVINSTDLLPNNVRSLIEKALSRSQMQTVAGALSLKIAALMTTNIDVLDKLSWTNRNSNTY